MDTSFSRRRIVSALLASTAWIAILSDPAAAACDPQVTNNVVANCTGTTLNQAGGAPGTSTGTFGYGTDFVSNVTVTVVNGARVTGSQNGLNFLSGTVTNAGTIVGLGGADLGGVVAANDLNVTNSGSITGTSGVSSNGSATVSNSGSILATSQLGVATTTTLNLINSGSITANAGSAVNGAGLTVTNSGTITGTTGVNGSAGVIALNNSGTIRGATNIGVRAPGTLMLGNSGTISGATIGVNTGPGVATIDNSGSITGGTVAIGANAALNTINLVNSGTVTGQTGVRANVAGTITNFGTITGTTGTAIFFGTGASTLTIAAGSAINGLVTGGVNNVLQLGGYGNATFDVSRIGPQYQNITTLNVIGPSAWSLTGVSSYAGPVNVNGGVLAVNGNMASASLTTVNAGGTLGGTGTIGRTIVSGGTLAPGNSIGTLNVAGSLAFNSAATYLVEIGPAAADRTNVTGAATLGGATVSAMVTGNVVNARSTILTAAGGVAGTFNPNVRSDLAALVPTLGYDANTVYLQLALNYAAAAGPAGLSANQAAVGNALTGFFNRTGGIPMGFAALSPAGLTQVSGETATGAQQTTIDAMSQFMGVMTDPFTAGRGAIVPGAVAYADETLNYAAQRRPGDALAAIYRKAPAITAPQARWNVWAAGFGGARNTDGNAVTGSSNMNSSIGGVAIGADYWLSPTTVAGFALAGGGTQFSTANGSGRSDLFQAGAFVRHTAGSAYVSAAVAYGWQDITTDRNVAVAGVDRLQARFNANAFSGRIEGGNRYVAPWIGGIGLTPYAAAQVTAFDLPSYAESVAGGAGTFALAYDGKTVTATRSELGLRSDKSFAVADAILTLRGRAAWAHDFNTDRSIAATFQTLPGASFTVNGAAQARDAALTTASAEMKFLSGISLAATFEGEFSDVTRSYAGKGVVRYAW